MSLCCLKYFKHISTDRTKDVPVELVFDILTRLPIKSLMRFKSVCKPWYFLIEDPDFVDQHFQKSKTCLLTKFQDQGNKLNVSLLSNETLDILVQNIDLPYAGLEGFKGGIDAFRPCKGILCLDVNGRDVLLWNPASREMKLLPNQLSPAIPNHRIFAYFLGFGYDSKANDFKVVRITSFYYEDGDMSYLILEHILVCEVYQLKTDTWRKLDVVVPLEPHSKFQTSQLSVEGMCAWPSTPDATYGRVDLILFDITEERFATIALPGRYGWNRICDPPSRTFCTLNGSIGLIDHFNVESPIRYQIWVLNPIEETWTKLYSIEEVPGLKWPLGFHKNEELMLASTSGEVVLCDPATSTISRRIEFGGSPNPLSFNVFEYKESIVKLN